MKNKAYSTGVSDGRGHAEEGGDLQGFENPIEYLLSALGSDPPAALGISVDSFDARDDDFDRAATEYEKGFMKGFRSHSGKE